MDKNYRIHTNIINDTVLNVNMTQDYDFLEVLSLKLRQKDAYRLHSSNYGVIIGRVLANDAFGIPNVKVSVFIPKSDNEPSYIESVYPYTEVTDNDKEGRRYNLLPNDSNDDCYRIVGTFPSKRLVLDDDTTLEIYDKYWKFTTITNNAGDYMIFGVPSGNQQVHVDMDLSDIGMLSQTPRDFEYKGYNITMFDSARQFKESTNLDSLAQIFSQNKSVFVYPFWGDDDNGVAAITRCDIQIQYKFEPTCVFMGSIISDNEGNSIGHKCAPDVDNGMNDQLVTGEGTIEMIRKTPDGLTEEYSIQGNQLIDSNGVWCYQIPMNLDYIATDEYGNIIPTDNPNKGIPTRTQVRFRFSKIETGNEGYSRHTAKYLVPMNPLLIGTKPKSYEDGKYIERMYTFGSSTPDSCFRDLYWNNVYSVKNYIPKTQVAHRAYSPNYTGLKGSNLVDNQNPIPFNKLRIDLPFVYIVLCILFNIVALIVSGINHMINVLNGIIKVLNTLHDLKIPIIKVRPFGWIPAIGYIGCISLGGGLSSDNTAFYPGCDNRGMDAADCPEDMENCKKRASVSVLMDVVQQRLAEDFKIVKLDFYQDWLNGSLYMPLWYWRKRKKKTFLFVTLSSAKNEYCSCDKTYSRLKSYVTCNFRYTNKKLGVNDNVLPENENKWHRNAKRSGRIFFPYGLIKGVENKDGLTAYYYAAIQPTSDNEEMPMAERGSRFNAFRLFATDIILLGNLNENNLYGIPQFFKALPSTTANIPPIATVREANDNSAGNNRSNNELADEGETGPSLTTGMDWEDSGDYTPKYKDGLFMDLECTYARTKAKSCINVERLCELGMNLDMTFDSQYPTSTGLKVGTFESDGLITKIELDDTENRAMFATMNQIGFVPQTYQDSIGGKTTQVPDDITNYLVPKFKYMYPVDLDGRMQPIVERYRNGFQQALGDVTDDTYINFRLGDVEFTNNGNGQFYDGNSMPLYNNSYYFYFGVNKGNTAIEKFNQMFNAQCFKNKKTAFAITVNSKGKSYCQGAYKSSGDGDSYILAESDDIQKPYSYALYKSNGEFVASGSNIYDSSFEIIGKDNGSYNLIVTDVNGKSVTEHVVLSMDNIALIGKAKNLGTEYIDDSATTKSQICQDGANLSGEIRFTNLYIDTYSFKITSARIATSSDTVVTIDIYAENEKFINGETQKKAIVKITNLDNTELNPCLCSTIGDAFFYKDGEFGFKVYKPTSFLVEVSQVCNGEVLTSNTSSSVLVVGNGKEFQATINGVSTKFMNKLSDESATTSTTSTFLAYWSSVNMEGAYSFPKFTEEGLKIWNSVYKLNSLSTDNITNKRDIIRHKFECMFNLSDAVYIGNDNGTTFKYVANGGVQPILYRSVAPYYSDDNLDVISRSFIYGDNSIVITNPKYPLIVGKNYLDNYIPSHIGEWESPRFNYLYTENENVGRKRKYLGNYFAAFTNNGGYISEYEGDCDIIAQAVPQDAYVNLDYTWKKLGENVVIDTIPPLAYSSTTITSMTPCCAVTKPYLRTMTVDRRIDYDLFIVGPLNNRYNLFSIDAEKRSKLLNSTRVCGYIRNGIEMSYDEDYNIIDVDITGRIYVQKYGDGYYCRIGDLNIDIYSSDYGFTRDQVIEVTDKTTYISEIQDNQVICVNLTDDKVRGTRQEEVEYGNGYYIKGVIGDDGEIIRYDDGFHWIDGNGKVNVANPDAFYSIIENENNEQAHAKNTLEYTYTYPNDGTNAVHTEWVNTRDDSGYTFVNYGDSLSKAITESTGVDYSKTRLKQFYSFNICDIDCRQVLWYEYTKEGLAKYSNSTANTECTSNVYIQQYHSPYGRNLPDGISASTYYNFDLGIDTKANPPERFLDMNLLVPRKNIDIQITPCSYDIGIEQDDDGIIKATVNEGDSMEANPSFNGCITPLTYDEVLSMRSNPYSAQTNILDWGDMSYLYNFYKKRSRNENLGVHKIDMVVRYNKETSDGGELYFYRPRLITTYGAYHLKATVNVDKLKNAYDLHTRHCIGNDCKGQFKMVMLNASDGSINNNIVYNGGEDDNDDGRLIWDYGDGDKDVLTTEHPELYDVVASTVLFNNRTVVYYNENNVPIESQFHTIDDNINYSDTNECDNECHVCCSGYGHGIRPEDVMQNSLKLGNNITDDATNYFSFMVKKVYDNSMESNLTRRIETIELSDFYNGGGVNFSYSVSDKVDDDKYSKSGHTKYSIKLSGFNNFTDINYLNEIDLIGVMTSGYTTDPRNPKLGTLYVKKYKIPNTNISITRGENGDITNIVFEFRHEDVFAKDENFVNGSSVSYTSIVYVSILLKCMVNGREAIHRIKAYIEHVVGIDSFGNQI